MFRNKYKLLLFIMVTIAIHANGQQKKVSSPWQFRSINQVGLLNGEAGAAIQLQTTNGIQYKSWFAGIGVGLDYYRLRSIPLFFDIRKDLGSGKHVFFLYGNIGVNFNWITDKQKLANGMIESKDIRGGLYTDAGLGYKIRIGTNQSLLLSLGYSYTSIYAKTIDYTPTMYDGPPTYSDMKYNLNRISIKMGWAF